MRVLILGRSELLYDTALLLAAKHDICGVITAPATPEAKRREDDFRSLADGAGCPYLLAGKLDVSAVAMARACNADVAVSVNWVSIISKEFIDTFPHGVLNAHCGDLPKYRGNAVINWAMLRGESQIDISVHTMTPGVLDMGDVYAQGAVALTESSTIGTVIEDIGGLIPHLFEEALDRLPTAQPLKSFRDILEAPGFRCYPRLPGDGAIDWSRSVGEIDLLIRATTRPYPGAFTCLMLDGSLRKLVVWKARIVTHVTDDVGIPGQIILNDRESGETHVLTGKGVLALQQVQFGDEAEAFPPGSRFKSIRARFGLDQGTLIDLLANRTRA